MGKKWKQWQILYSRALKSLPTVTPATKLKELAPWKKSYDQPRESEVAQSSLTFCNTMYCSLHGPQSMNFPGKCTGVDCHFPLQMIFLTQGSNPGLPHFRKVLYRLSHQRTPITNLNNILKSKDITLLTKVCLVKLWFFQ